VKYAGVRGLNWSSPWK